VTSSKACMRNSEGVPATVVCATFVFVFAVAATAILIHKRRRNHLLAAKAAEPVDDSPLRPSIIIEPTARHTHSVIMLHGMYCEGSMFESLPSIMAELGGRSAGTRYIFPSAPLRTISWPTGSEPGVSAWYNYFTQKTGEMEHDAIDEEHLQQVTTAVHNIIDREVAALGGDATRVAIGGNSQGGTVAGHAALTYPNGPLGALIFGCSVLLDVTPVKKRHRPRNDRRLPVFTFTAEHDQEYIPPFQKRCYARLRDAGYTVISHVEPGLDHYTESLGELHHTAAWIAQTLFGQHLTVSHRDVPEAPAPAAPLF
jgi:predicted esterase